MRNLLQEGKHLAGLCQEVINWFGWSWVRVKLDPERHLYTFIYIYIHLSFLEVGWIQFHLIRLPESHQVCWPFFAQNTSHSRAHKSLWRHMAWQLFVDPRSTAGQGASWPIHEGRLGKMIVADQMPKAQNANPKQSWKGWQLDGSEVMMKRRSL